MAGREEVSEPMTREEAIERLKLISEWNISILSQEALRVAIASLERQKEVEEAGRDE